MRPKNLTTALCLLTVCSLGALTTGGCADNRTTLFVVGVAQLVGGDECTVEVSLTTDLIGQGLLDASLRDAYIAPLILANGLQPLGNNDTLRPETSRIQLQGAEIAIDSQTGGAAGPAFTQYFSGTINPDPSEDPGLAAVSVEIIPRGLALSPGKYAVNIVVFGETLGGTDVESGEFSFPVEVLEPGALAACFALEEDDLHPCGWHGQDGFPYPCSLNPCLPTCLDVCGTPAGTVCP